MTKNQQRSWDIAWNFAKSIQPIPNEMAIRALADEILRFVNDELYHESMDEGCDFCHSPHCAGSCQINDDF